MSISVSNAAEAPMKGNEKKKERRKKRKKKKSGSPTASGVPFRAHQPIYIHSNPDIDCIGKQSHRNCMTDMYIILMNWVIVDTQQPIP